MINLETLREDIANAACESVDNATLMRMYYDDQINYLKDLDLDELMELAEEQLMLTTEELQSKYEG